MSKRESPRENSDLQADKIASEPRKVRMSRVCQKRSKLKFLTSQLLRSKFAVMHRQTSRTLLLAEIQGRSLKIDLLENGDHGRIVTLTTIVRASQRIVIYSRKHRDFMTAATMVFLRFSP